ncbi:MAG: hypothetical protein KY469_22045 [Actinobacteria bacterium]|nr:hypothetical protein [Actinomycetota bacterium]
MVHAPEVDQRRVAPRPPADDAALARVVASTSRAVERYCRRRTFGKDAAPTVRVFDADNYDRVQVDDIATATGLVVATDDDDDGTFEHEYVHYGWTYQPAPV